MTKAVGILAQVCGWLFVLAAFLCPLIGLVMVLAPPPEMIFMSGYTPLTVTLFLLPLLLVPAAIGFVYGGGSLRRDPVRHGICRRCGYDMRGGGNRCPECGSPL
ncbi:MAG: hypothetical protein ACYTEI_13870 [Planctomycetota bacterium]|jgi:hypothetical protein